MTCGEAVRAFVATLTPVTTLVSGRIFLTYLPQAPEPAKLPCILVQQIDDVQQPHLRGTIGMKVARIQVDCVGVTMAQTRAVDQAVMGDYLNGAPTGLRGISGVSSGGVTFHQALADNYFEQIATDELHYQKRVTRDYRIWYDG